MYMFETPFTVKGYLGKQRSLPLVGDKTDSSLPNGHCYSTQDGARKGQRNGGKRAFCTLWSEPMEWIRGALLGSYYDRSFWLNLLACKGTLKDSCQ